VHHGVDAGDGLAHIGRAAHVAPHHLDQGRVLCGPVVDKDTDMVPAGDEPGHERGPERAGRACHERQRHLSHLSFTEAIRYCSVVYLTETA